MTDTQSLSERLRAHLREGHFEELKTEGLLEMAADTLDAKDAEIDVKDFLIAERNAEIELLKEGRKLHDELADHLEHEIDAKDIILAGAASEIGRLIALLAQAAAALESLTKDPPSSLAREPDTDCEVVLKMREIAREALAALRAKGVP